MRLHLIHRDLVNLNSIPHGFINIGGSAICDVQGVYKRGRVLTLQGHPEFENNIIVDFGKPILGNDALHEITDGADDHAYAARAILEFFQEEATEEKVSEAEVGENVVREGEVAEGEVTEGEVTKGNGIEKLVSLFEKLSVCEHAPVLGGY